VEKLIERSIRESHLKLAEARGFDKTYCPSEVARIIDPINWREKMHIVREVADELVLDNKLVTLQRGEVISELPSGAKGPIRLRKK